MVAIAKCANNPPNGLSDLGYGFFDLGQDDEATEHSSGRHWAWYQCARLDYEMARYALDGSQNEILHCLESLCAVRCFELVRELKEDPQLAELR